LTHVAPGNFGQVEIMLCICRPIYVQISPCRLALVIENFKAYFLALLEIPKTGRPDRGEMDKNVCATFGLYESVAF
jgi:hypothetical protein